MSKRDITIGNYVPGSALNVYGTVCKPAASGATLAGAATLVAPNPTQGSPVTGLTVTAGGAGYTSQPTIAITGGGGTGATATAVISYQGVITSLVINNPGSGYTTAPTVAITGGGGTGATATAQISPVATVYTTGFTQPDCPRSLKFAGNTATMTGNLVVTGTNAADQAASETVVLAGTTVVETVRAFKTITSISVPVRGAAADGVVLTTGGKLGLDFALKGDYLLFANLAGVREVTRPTVTFDTAGLDAGKSTVQLVSAYNGSLVELCFVDFENPLAQ